LKNRPNAPRRHKAYKENHRISFVFALSFKNVPEVCRIFCATANPTEVIIAESQQGRGILGVIDGFSPKGVEDEAGIAWRKRLLRQIGYKL
jgi:uncharacterized protein